MKVGTPEVLLLLALSLLIFGPILLPKMAGSIGEARRQLKRPSQD